METGNHTALVYLQYINTMLLLCFLYCVIGLLHILMHVCTLFRLAFFCCFLFICLRTSWNTGHYRLKEYSYIIKNKQTNKQTNKPSKVVRMTVHGSASSLEHDTSGSL